MTVPVPGIGDISGTDYGVTADGSIPGMSNRTQGVVQAALKSGVAASTAWAGANAALTTTIRAPIAEQRVVSVSSIPYVDAQVVRSIFLTSGTWQRPTIPDGKRIQKIGFAAINGGSGGNGPTAAMGDGSEGGDDGGFYYKEFRDSDIPTQLLMQPGAGGAGGGTGTAGQAGGTSYIRRLDSTILIQGRTGTSVLFTMQGPVASSARPGRGGAGGGAIGNSEVAAQSAGQKGQNTALALGGNGGSVRQAGQAGQAADTDPIIVSGGGGGGGGGGGCGVPGDVGGIPNAYPRGGGDGGAPGGGGGGAGGGLKPLATSAPYPSGGRGANGACIAWVYLEEDIPL